jgi:hypothetical protein
MLLRCAGEEDLLGVGGDDAVEAELASVLGAQLEEKAGAVAGLDIDDIDEAHVGCAVEVGGVGDVLDGGFEFAEAVVLRNDGDVAKVGSCAGGVGGVDVGCGAAVAEGVGLELLIEQRYGDGCRGGVMGVGCGGGCSCGFLYGWGGSGGFGGWGFGVGGELGAGHGLHLVEDCGVLGGIVPFEGEGVWVAIGGV